MPPQIIIRADANSQTGIGHMMRCIALCQSWKKQGGEVNFITYCENESLLNRLEREDFRVTQLQSTYPDLIDWYTIEQAMTKFPDAWVVIDGYHFDHTYQLKVKKSGHRLLVIDDMAHLRHYYGDLVLNQNISAESLHYSCEPYTRLLLGPRYTLIRSEFLSWRGRSIKNPVLSRKLLITMGGGDYHNITLKVINTLKRFDIFNLNIKITVGPSNPHIKILKKAILFSGKPIQIFQNEKNMPELMDWADVAITAGGSTCWELAFMGVPFLAFIVAENQKK
jgi:UDP-2,4-diacetamido-2,4,6-trideoxy-beta-L-altropyranose hydrolase